MMVLNADEGNPGDKSKIFSMQEGPDINDITTDDYRMTAELRGRNYGAPGSVTFRIIPGDGEPLRRTSPAEVVQQLDAGTSGASRGKPGTRVSK